MTPRLTPPRLTPPRRTPPRPTPSRVPPRRAAVTALLAAPLLAAGLSACESREVRERRLAAERDSVMLAAATRDAEAEAAFRSDSAALAASLAVDTVAGAFLRTRAVSYLDDDDVYQTAEDTVYTVVGRRLGFCEDVSLEVARGRAPGDTLTCQWALLGDSVLANAAPLGADKLPTPFGVLVAGAGVVSPDDTVMLNASPQSRQAIATIRRVFAEARGRAAADSADSADSVARLAAPAAGGP